MAWAEVVRIEGTPRQQEQPEKRQHPCTVPQSGQGSETAVTGARRARRANKTKMRIAECRATESFYSRAGAAPGRFQKRRAATSGARSRDSFFAQLARRAAGIEIVPGAAVNSGAVSPGREFSSST